MTKPWYLRQNGQHMITTSVKFHLNLDDLACVIARRLELPDGYRDMAPMQLASSLTDAASRFTKTRLLREARDELRNLGMENLWTVVWSMAEEYEESYGEQLLKVGRARVAELFPEMVTTTTTTTTTEGGN